MSRKRALGGFNPQGGFPLQPPSFDPVTNTYSPVVQMMGERAMKQRAMQRVRGVYERLPKYMQGSAPVVHLNAPPGARGLIGLTNRQGGNRLGLGRETTQDLAGVRGGQSQKAAQKVFIHELGHTLNMNEAQAETNSRKLSHRLFGDAPYYDTYPEQVQALRQRHGDNTSRYIRKQHTQQPAHRNAGTIRGDRKRRWVIP